jgi:thiamine pyrophosphokinase
VSSGIIVSSEKPLCLVGGAAASIDVINDISQWVEGFVAVDSGADVLLDAGVTPRVVIGDLDSISPQSRAAFQDRLCEIKEQSTTDFEKALCRVTASALIALGFTGGRMDHILSVLSVMVRYPEKPVILTDAHDASFLASAGQTVFTLPQGTRVSLMPVTPATVSVDGVVWPFSQMQMTMAGFTSPSNAALGGDVSITTDAPVLVTLPRAHLQTALKVVARG